MKKAILVIGVIFATSGLILYSSRSMIKEQVVTSIKEKITDDFLSGSHSKNIRANRVDRSDSSYQFKFAAITDSHNNIDGLKQTINLINQSDSEFILGLGDYTNVGTHKELSGIHSILSKSKKPGHYLPGDHDLWNGRDKTDNPHIYFSNVFGNTPKSFQHKDVTFIFIDNSDLYVGLSAEEEGRVISEIESVSTSNIVICSHKAIYHPLTIHKMGYINDVKQFEVEEQSQRLTKKITSMNNKKIYMLHGDLHNSSTFKGPTDNVINMTVGALSKEKNFQQPRFAEFTVYSDGEIEMIDKQI